jgi:putative transposase
LCKNSLARNRRWERKRRWSKIQLVEQHRIDRYDSRWQAIDAAAFASKNLYNAALYVTRQAIIHQSRVLSYEDLAREMKRVRRIGHCPPRSHNGCSNKSPLPGRAISLLCAAWKADPSHFLGHPKLPKYLDKRARNLLTYTEQAISRAPMNRGYVVPSGLPIRVETRQTAIDQVRSVTPAEVDPARVAAIDIGLNNLAAVTFHQPGLTPFLVNGRPLKALNQWYNKRRAHLQAKLPEGVYTSRQLDILADKRQRQITSYLHVASRRIVEWVVKHRVGTLVVGKIDGWKQAIRLGKRTNQNFVFVPHARFVEMLQYKAELLGIHVIVARRGTPPDAASSISISSASMTPMLASGSNAAYFALTTGAA